MTVPQLGVVEIPVAIKGNDAYLSIEGLFEVLQVKKIEVPSGIIGFLIHQDSTYHIDYRNSEITYNEIVFPITENDLIQSPTDYYLKSDFFGKIFGLHTVFSFRDLSVNLETTKELPFIKQSKREKARENLGLIQGEINPDTLMPRRYPFFKPGFIDWGVTSTQQTHILSDNRFTLGAGSMFLGGETNLLLNYSTNVPMKLRNQYYQWRLVNNYSTLFKQVSVGRISSNATSSLSAPLNGILISNSPFQNRRSFGTYTLSNFTEPRWTVELYINNVLVDFTQADASGFYTFEVPLMYGNTNVDLRFYGPYGEERSEETMINIPYNFVPKNEFEYSLRAGIFDDNINKDKTNQFSRLDMNYGLNNSITIGGGIEYLSNIPNEEFMPFLNSSIRVAQGLLFMGEYVYGVKGEAIVSYRAPRNVQVDLNYVNYDSDQKALNYNYLEQRKISISAPIRTKGFYMFGRMSLNQLILPNNKLTTAQLLMSGAVMGINTNITTYGVFNSNIDESTIYSSLSQTYRLPYKVIFSPRIQYDVSNSRFTSMNMDLERPVFKNGFMNVGYQNDLIRKDHIFEFGLRYSFDMAQTSFSSRFGKNNNTFVESAQGSILFDDNTGYVMAGNRTSVSRAALTVIPFLDLNWNGRKDPMEPGVPGLELSNRTGNVSYNKDRTVIRITELQPYTDFLLQVDPVSLDNIAWKIPNPKIGVHTTPNQFQEIHVPVQVLGEVGGMVYLKDPKGTRGLGRIRIKILNRDDSVAAEFLTEGDGYFTYLGLAPGHYRAIIDSEQLDKLNYKSRPNEIPFNIEIDKYGDIVDTIEFFIHPEPESEVDTVSKSPMDKKEVTKVPEKKRLFLIDLGERGLYAFSDTDENIKLLQKFLNELGYTSGEIDGIYGTRTFNAVKNFQIDAEVSIDGILGPETLNALKAILIEEDIIDQE